MLSAVAGRAVVVEMEGEAVIVETGVGVRCTKDDAPKEEEGAVGTKASACTAKKMTKRGAKELWSFMVVPPD